MSDTPVPTLPQGISAETATHTDFCAQADVQCAAALNMFADNALIEAASALERLALPINANDHAQGPENAPVTLVEYGDFECPACGQAYPVVREAQRRMGERLRFVFRHFPLRQVHPHAQRAAEASECAGAQGQFWAMHDTRIAHQNALDNGAIVECADRIGLAPSGRYFGHIPSPGPQNAQGFSPAIWPAVHRSVLAGSVLPRKRRERRKVYGSD